MFLQEMLLQYEMTFPDWRNSPQSEAMLLEIRQKLATAEATQVPPSFVPAEILFIQETLLEYESDRTDWANTLADFNLMQYTMEAVETGLPSSDTYILGGTDIGIVSPPVADPEPPVE
jgi:hypothetical protein